MDTTTTTAAGVLGAAVRGQLDILTAARREIDRQITQVAAALLGRCVRERWPAAHAIVVGTDRQPVAVLDQAGRVIVDDNGLREPCDDSSRVVGGDVGDRLWELIAHLPPAPWGRYAGGEGRILALPAASVSL